MLPLLLHVGAGEVCFFSLFFSQRTTVQLDILLEATSGLTIFGEVDSTHILDPQSDSHQLSARYGQLGEKSLHRVGQTLLKQGVPTAAPVAIQTYSLNSWT